MSNDLKKPQWLIERHQKFISIPGNLEKINVIREKLRTGEIQIVTEEVDESELEFALKRMNSMSKEN